MSLPNTHYGIEGLGALLAPPKRLFFVGIGGVHMAALASIAHARGFAVSGSDAVGSERTDALCARGIRVHIGHSAAWVEGCDALIYTLAIPADNPEYCAALAAGIPVISRADLLAFLTAENTRRIGVAGSHGKSTVTAMLAEIFTAAGRDPTVLCGATLPAEGGPVRVGTGKDCIFEACEYGNSFLAFRPTIALLLNVDFDHADFFRDMDALASSFAAFAALPGEGGTLIYNAVDTRAVEAARATRARTYGFGLARGDCYATELRYVDGCGHFALCLMDRICGEIALRVPGEHNVKNALAAALAAATAGIPTPTVLQALSRFTGAARRMQLRGTLRGARVLDDYAHHPAEIEAVLCTARQITPPTGRVFAVFQPHTYSRTKALFAGFCKALRAADRVLLADVYAAREKDSLGVQLKALAAGIGAHAQDVGSLAEIAARLKEEVHEGDTVLVMGAGDVDRIFTEFSPKDFTLLSK